MGMALFIVNAVAWFLAVLIARRMAGVIRHQSESLARMENAMWIARDIIQSERPDEAGRVDAALYADRPTIPDKPYALRQNGNVKPPPTTPRPDFKPVGQRPKQ